MRSHWNRWQGCQQLLPIRRRFHAPLGRICPWLNSTFSPFKDKVPPRWRWGAWGWQRWVSVSPALEYARTDKRCAPPPTPYSPIGRRNHADHTGIVFPVDFLRGCEGSEDCTFSSPFVNATSTCRLHTQCPQQSGTEDKSVRRTMTPLSRHETLQTLSSFLWKVKSKGKQAREQSDPSSLSVSIAPSTRDQWGGLSTWDQPWVWRRKLWVQGTGLSGQLQPLNPHALRTWEVDLSTVKHSSYRRHRVLREGNIWNWMASAVELSWLGEPFPTSKSPVFLSVNFG